MTKIGGTLNVGPTQENTMGGGNPSLVNLTGLTSSIDVQYINIRQNSALTSLTGLEYLTSIEGNLYIRDNPITSLSGVNNLSFVGEYLVIRNTLLENLSELENLEFMLEVYMWLLTMELQSLAGLENIEFTGGSLGVSDNDQLVIYLAFKSLIPLAESLVLEPYMVSVIPLHPGGNDLLTVISALINLKYVGEGIDIGHNNSLPACRVGKYQCSIHYGFTYWVQCFHYLHVMCKAYVIIWPRQMAR